MWKGRARDHDAGGTPKKRGRAIRPWRWGQRQRPWFPRRTLSPAAWRCLRLARQDAGRGRARRSAPRLKSFPLPRAREYLRLHHPPSCGHQPEARGQRRGHGGATGREHWGGAAGGAKRPFEFPIRSVPVPLSRGRGSKTGILDRRPTTLSRSPSAGRTAARCARARATSGRLPA